MGKKKLTKGFTPRRSGYTATNHDVIPRLMRSAGFTLAEVLITLGIIGVVAAITIPSLVANYREKQFVTKLKKTVAVVANAYKLTIDENGGTDFGYLERDWAHDDNGVLYDKNASTNAEMFYQAMSKHLKITLDCGKEGRKVCFPESIYSPFDENDEWNLLTAQGNARRFFMLNDGVSIGVVGNNGEGYMYIDLNGLEKPNTLRIDVFQIALKPDGSVGYYDDGTDPDGKVMCYDNQLTCAGWVMRNNNIDYIHCNDLNWKTKLRCKK